MTDPAPHEPAVPGRWVDSHAHLDMPEFDPDREEVLRRAAAAGVAMVLCPAELSEERSLPAVLALSGTGNVVAAAGVHPHRATAFGPGHERRLEELAGAGQIRAVGEIGLDYHYGLSPRDAQRAALRAQLAAAARLGLPAIIHSRASGADIVEDVDTVGFGSGGILHCFTETWDIAARMIDRGFLVSFSGILTFPNAGALRDVARKVPLDRLLVETDAPYLAPVPHRGRRNEPAFVIATIGVLARLRGLDPARLADATAENFFRLFPAR